MFRKLFGRKTCKVCGAPMTKTRSGKRMCWIEYEQTEEYGHVLRGWETGQFRSVDGVERRS